MFVHKSNSDKPLCCAFRVAFLKTYVVKESNWFCHNFFDSDKYVSKLILSLNISASCKLYGYHCFIVLRVYALHLHIVLHRWRLKHKRPNALYRQLDSLKALVTSKQY
jgi:hypothetical protein